MSADLSNLARQPWANAEQSLEANLNNPLRSWDGRDRVGAATARKAMRAYAGAHKMFAMSAITALTAQNRATDEPDSAYCSGAVFSASCGFKSCFKSDFAAECGLA